MATYTQEKYSLLHNATYEVLKSLYAISIASLSAADRAKHQQQINVVYAAYLKLEAREYSTLSAEASKRLPAITTAAKRAQESLAGLKKDTEVLATVDTVLNMFISLVALI
jgi:hypothetical protein